MSLEREFVLYEQALYLKELGFNEPCLSRYCRVTEWEVPTGKILFQLSDCELNKKNLIKAPTFSQCFRWFREKYRYFQLFDYQHGDSKINKGFFFNIVNIDNEDFFFPEDFENQIYKTYEEAELECLKKLIEIVKESKDGNN